MQFGWDVCGPPSAAKRLGRVFRVRRRGEKVPAESKEDLRAPFVHRLNRVYRIVTVAAWWFEIEFRTEAFKKLFARLFPDAHGAITLHVAMTTDRTKSRARFANLAAQKHQVDDLLNVADRVLVLRQTHRPAKDYALRLDENSRRVLDFYFRDSGLLENVTPMNFAQRRAKLFKAARILFYELMINYP